MNAVQTIRNYADNARVKENLTCALAEIKKYTDRAIAAVKAVSRIDTMVIGAVCASAGAILGCIFSKSCKKLLAVLAMICGFGSAYLIYKKYFKD